MSDSKFRERRSAFRDEGEATEPESAPAPPEPPSTARASVQSEPSPSPLQDATAESAIPPESLPDADLEQLAAMEVPPPSFFDLVEPHVEMALRFLGQLPLTPDGDRRVLPQWAKREIDLLGILEERTRNQLPAEERRMLDQALDQLRTLYLRVTP